MDRILFIINQQHLSASTAIIICQPVQPSSSVSQYSHHHLSASTAIIMLFTREIPTVV